MHPSVKLMWEEYLACQLQPSAVSINAPAAWYFCDNEADAGECAQLVLTGRKRATSPSLRSFDSSGEALPRVGDLNVVTDWSGQAVCIIRTTKVQTVPFNEINGLHASIEGEGDGSLEWWREVHWSYYHRELAGTGFTPEQDMPIVFQEFERIFPANEA